MIGLEEYKNIISELLDELPDAFFRELTGGVIVSEALSVPDYARKNDLYVMGLYRVFSGVRQIVLYKGSFDRAYPLADAAEARKILRGVLRHEFRHHLEFLSGDHGASSLEAEDERKKRAYLARRPEAAASVRADQAPAQTDGGKTGQEERFNMSMYGGS